jgi:hypothetical protein
MMKSRVTTYLLIVAVVAVWGFVAWRIFSSKAEPIAAPVVWRVESDAAEDAPDVLRLDYDDPFLKDVAILQPAVEVVVEPPPKPRQPPSMKYAGTIATRGKTSYILESGGLLHSLAVGDELEGYTLRRAFADSVWMARDGQIDPISR